MLAAQHTVSRSISKASHTFPREGWARDVGLTNSSSGSTYTIFSPRSTRMAPVWVFCSFTYSF